MALSPQTQKNPTSSSQSSTREQTQEQFRQYLRQADKFIKEQHFTQAKQELVEAKKLDPSNPFIIAFEERIAMFEKGIPPKTPIVAKPLPEPIELPVQPLPAEVVEAPVDREAIERKIREKVEEEYKIRFTKELRRAEEHAAKILDEERAKLESQRHALNIKYEQQLDEIRQRLEGEYRAKLADEISHAEARLKEQSESKLHMMEEELKTQLTLSHATEIREMEGKLRHEHELLLERERASFQEREQSMKAQFDRRLQDELKSTESVVREQTQQQQQEEQNKQRNQMMEELQAALHKEREASKIEYDALKKKMEESYLAEQQKLTGEHQRRLEEEIQTMRQRETEEFERKCVAVRQNVEEELRASFDQQISAERRRLHEEAETMIETEKKRLHDEYSEKLDHQESNIKSMRTALQKEMESSFLKRMEQIADLLLYASTKTEPGKHTTLDDYVKNMPIAQAEIYYITGRPDENVIESPYLEAFREKGYEVLIMTDDIDDIIMLGLQEYKGKKIKSVVKGDISLDAAGQADKKKAQGKFEKLIARIKEQLKDEVKDVRLSGRLKDSACCLVADEGGLDPQMEKLLKSMGQDVPSGKRVLEINPDHQVFSAMNDLIEKGGQDELVKEYIGLLYDQALLLEGSKVKEPAAFAKAMARLMSENARRHAA